MRIRIRNICFVFVFDNIRIRIRIRNKIWYIVTSEFVSKHIRSESIPNHRPAATRLTNVSDPNPSLAIALLLLACWT
jgi:hypothetical protein